MCNSHKTEEAIAKEWLKKSRAIGLEMIFFDHTKENFEVEEVVREIANCGANTVRFAAISWKGEAQYPSKVAPMAEGLEGRDLLKEMREATNRHDIRLIVYINDLNRTLVPKHPEWVKRNEHGELMFLGDERDSKQGFCYFTCINSPWLEEFYLKVIDEIVGYEPDGIYLDCNSIPRYLGKYVCYCKYCREEFRKVSGKDIPSQKILSSSNPWKDPVALEFREWIRGRIKSFYEKVFTRIHQKNPRIAVTNNAGTYTSLGLDLPVEEQAKIFDGLLLEAYIRNIGAELWHAGENAKFADNLSIPVFVHAEYFSYRWRFSYCSPSELAVKIGFLIANGANPLLAEYPFHEKEGLKAVKPSYSLIKENEEFLVDTKPISSVALIYSRKTAEFYDKRDTLEKHENLFRGGYLLLSQTHTMFDVLHSDLSGEDLGKYKAIYLPNAACLDEKEIQIIQDYVKSGGGLIASYESSLFNEKCLKRDDFGLNEVMGVKYLKTKRINSGSYVKGVYMKAKESHEVTKGFHDGQLLPLPDALVITEVKKAKGLCTTIIPQPPEVSLGKESAYPSLLINEFGKGRVVYFPFGIESLYLEYRFPILRRLFDNAVKWVTQGGTLLKIETAPTVEATLRGKDSVYIIHLINYTNSERILEAPCPQEVKIEFRLPDKKKVKNIKTLSKKRIAFDESNGILRISLQLETYEGIVIISD